MTKTARPEAAPRGWLRFPALLLALALAACGPGTGGTGTGPVGASTFAGTGSPTLGSPGSAPCVGDCNAFQLRLDAEHVEFAVPCGRFLHEGPWTTGANGLAFVTGTFEAATTNGPRVVAATLQLQFVGDPDSSTEVTATVLDAQGLILVGPLALQREANAAQPPAASACS